jgi:NAD-dependent deacetylase
MSDVFQEVAQAIHDAKLVAILTGAGVSKESGVPTFRDAMEGLWAKYDPQELATPTAFLANPKLVWDWYQWRREMIKKAQPNPGHIALAKLQEYKQHVHVITQNVDDLHEQAGSKDIIHLHGNIAQDKCFDNCQGDPTLVDISLIIHDKDAGPPPCPYCFGLVRPNVVWFGEMLSPDDIRRAAEISQTCDVMLVVGTSGMVSPASQLPGIAKAVKAKIVEVNPDETPISRLADWTLRGASGVMLPKVIEALDEIKN